MKSILDPSFRYTPSFNTDLRRTFARIRRSQRDDLRRSVHPASDAPIKVSSIVGRMAKVRS